MTDIYQLTPHLLRFLVEWDEYKTKIDDINRELTKGDNPTKGDYPFYDPPLYDPDVDE